MNKTILTREMVETYWQTKNQIPLFPFLIDDFFELWAREEGIRLEEGFSINSYNDKFYTVINKRKYLTANLLKTFNYEHIEVEALPNEFDSAFSRAKQLLYLNQNIGVIRADKMSGGVGTFIVHNATDISNALKFIMNDKGQLALFSKYYEADVELSAFILDGTPQLVIEKNKNPTNNLHNLSLGATASIVTDNTVLSKVKYLCTNMNDLFRFKFGRVDILVTNEGFKIIELSDANFKKFALQNIKCFEFSKRLFLDYVEASSKW